MHILCFGCQLDSLDFFINTLLCVAMVTMLMKSILPNVWLFAADCNKVYTNRALSTLIAYNYLILTFKAKRSLKNTLYVLELDLLSHVSMVTAQASRHYFPPLVMDGLHEYK